MEREEWIDMMEYQSEIRLFAGITLKKARKGGLTSAQEVDLLFRVALAEKPMTPLELSHAMGVSKTIISRLIEDLTVKKLILRQYNKEDKRSYFLTATEAGRAELDSMCRYYIGPIYELRRKIGNEDFLQLLSLIKKANKGMQKETGKDQEGFL